MKVSKFRVAWGYKIFRVLVAYEDQTSCAILKCLTFHSYQIRSNFHNLYITITYINKYNLDKHNLVFITYAYQISVTPKSVKVSCRVEVQNFPVKFFGNVRRSNFSDIIKYLSFHSYQIRSYFDNICIHIYIYIYISSHVCIYIYLWDAISWLRN